MAKAVPSPSFQNRATCVCSAVRVVLVALPRLLTSLNAAAYAALSSAGGGGGRNCEPPVIANGVTYGHWGASAGRLAGGVGCQSPGSVPGVYGTVAPDPSVLRQSRICRAASLPTSVPWRARPGGMPARSAARAASKVAAWAGNRAESASWAAWAAAASGEAPREAWTLAWYGSNDRSMATTASYTAAWVIARA